MIQLSCKISAFVILFFSVTSTFVFGQEGVQSSAHEVINPFEHHTAIMAPFDEFDFNDGTCQGWTVDGPRDENGNGPFASHFSASWADAVSYPTAYLTDPLGDNNGSYKICNVMGHGITNPGATYWYMYWISPDLSAESAWQDAGGYSIKIQNNMELIAGDIGDHLQLWINLFVTVYDHDQSKDRYFRAFTSYQEIQTWSENPAWISKSLDFTAAFDAVPNHTIKDVYIGVMGRMSDYFEGGIYLDEVVPAGGKGSPMISLNVSDLDFGMDIHNLSFDISNTGGGKLSWTVTENPDVSWITSISPASGSGIGIATVEVTVDRSQLTQTTETGHLLVASNGGNADVILTIAQDTISQWIRSDIETKLLADDGEAADNFGFGVAIGGDYAAVGAPYDDNEKGVDAGAVYIFKRSSSDTWSQQQKLLAADGAAEDYFGYSVAISGDYLIVGTPWDDDDGEKSGSAYIFKLSGSTWTQQDKVTASDAGVDNRFGINVAIDGDYAIVGAFFDDDFGTRTGSAYIYERSGTDWIEREILHASDAAANDWFGVSVSIYGDYAAVGSRYDDNENGTDAGGVYVFKRSGVDWLEQKKVIASDGAAGDLFHETALYGDYLVVGAYQDDDDGSNSGSIYIFQRNGTDWVEQAKHTASDADAGDMFGAGLAIYGNRLLVSAYRNKDHGSNSGSIYIFQNDGSAWSEKEKIISSDGEPGDYFGEAISSYQDYVIVAARNDDDNGENAGAAYIYHLTSAGDPVLQVSPTTLDFGTTKTSLDMQITNTGAPGLTWDISLLTDLHWISSIIPSSGSDNATVTIIVDHSDLGMASDTGIIRVNSNGGSQDVTLLIAKEITIPPDTWNFTANTGNSANILLPTAANPNIDGVPLQNGDYVGVFTPAKLCCGWKQWANTNTSITVWGDDDQTTEVDGFQTGESISYRVFRMSEGKEWDCVAVAYSTGTGSYAANALMVLSQFDVSSQSAMILHFNTGWNMFSLNVVPDDPNIATVMNPVVAKLVIAKNGYGQTYIPAYSVNDINNMTFNAGYQAYFTEATSLNVFGAPLAAGTPIILSGGWHLISYLPTTPINITTALATVNNHLVIAKNNNGQTYIPEYGINDIGTMEPGQGYQVYLTGADTLIYPAGSAAKLSAMSKPAVEHFSFVTNTGDNATLVIPADINPRYSDGSLVEEGDEIGVFTNSGLCCGAIVWKGVNQALTVWGDDDQTTEVDGFTSGDTFRLRIWHKTTDIEYAADVIYKSGHSCVYQSNGLSVLTELIAGTNYVGVEDTKPGSIPTDFKLFQNYPNPFNPSTTIRFSIPEPQNVTLSVYDLLGHLVTMLVAEKMRAGYYNVVFDAAGLASGVYFYRIQTESFVSTKRFILLK